VSTEYDDTYKRLTHRVHMRDGWKCRCPGCKARSGLHAHHIIFRSQGGPNHEDNMITLCNYCHTAVHDHNLLITFVGYVHDTLFYEWKYQNGWSPSRRLA
jgi:5-methylcytosine-specific restriction endonuclease McrA